MLSASLGCAWPHHVTPQVYNISSSKAVPQWISDAKKKSIRKSEEFRRRLELLQDFRFPAACQRIKVSPDGQYVFASGYHPPQVSTHGAIFAGMCACIHMRTHTRAHELTDKDSRQLQHVQWSVPALVHVCFHYKHVRVSP